MNFHKTFLFRKENITNNDVIIRQQIALRKEQLELLKKTFICYQTIFTLLGNMAWSQVKKSKMISITSQEDAI